MEIRLHANATTTPKQRAYIQQSTRPAAELAESPDLWRVYLSGSEEGPT